MLGESRKCFLQALLNQNCSRCQFLLTMFFFRGTTSRFIAIACFLTYGFAKPISLNNSNVEVISTRTDWNWKLEDIHNEFRGLDFTHAFKTCKPHQLDTLIFATRAAMWMLDSVQENKAYPYSEAWGRYFYPYQEWVVRGDQLRNVASQIQCECLVLVSRVAEEVSSWRHVNTQNKPYRQRHSAKRRYGIILQPFHVYRLNRSNMVVLKPSSMSPSAHFFLQPKGGAIMDPMLIQSKSTFYKS